LFFDFFSKICPEDEFNFKTKQQREDDKEEDEIDVESLKKLKFVVKKWR
jgi:hypothetical protein